MDAWWTHTDHMLRACWGNVMLRTLRYLIIVQQILLIFEKSPTYMLLFHPTLLFISGKSSYLHNYSILHNFLVLWFLERMIILFLFHENRYTQFEFDLRKNIGSLFSKKLHKTFFYFVRFYLGWSILKVTYNYSILHNY